MRIIFPIYIFIFLSKYYDPTKILFFIYIIRCILLSHVQRRYDIFFWSNVFFTRIFSFPSPRYPSPPNSHYLLTYLSSLLPSFPYISLALFLPHFLFLTFSFSSLFPLTSSLPSTIHLSHSFQTAQLFLFSLFILFLAFYFHLFSFPFIPLPSLALVSPLPSSSLSANPIKEMIVKNDGRLSYDAPVISVTLI